MTGFANVVIAQTGAPGANDIGALKNLPFEELFNIAITTVSKRSERLVDAASAIQVITPEEIRRSGASMSIALLACFLALLIAQGITGHLQYNETLKSHGQLRSLLQNILRVPISSKPRRKIGRANFCKCSSTFCLRCFSIKKARPNPNLFQNQGKKRRSQIVNHVDH